MVLLVLQSMNAMYLKPDTDRKTGHSRKISFSKFSLPCHSFHQKISAVGDRPCQGLQDSVKKLVQNRGGRGVKMAKNWFFVILADLDWQYTSSYIFLQWTGSVALQWANIDNKPRSMRGCWAFCDPAMLSARNSSLTEKSKIVEKSVSHLFLCSFKAISKHKYRETISIL